MTWAFKIIVLRRQLRHRETWIIPSFPAPLSNQTVLDGRSATMECQVAGRPRPRVTWTLDGAAVLDSTGDVIRTSHDTETGRCRLEIDEVLPEDEGMYTATATNEVGSVSTSAYLTVQRT